MRKFKRGIREQLWLCASAIGLFATAATAAADGNTIEAVIDKARLVRVPDKTQTLVIGNPTVADVTLVKNNSSDADGSSSKQNNLMVLVPRSFGETNFLALDGKGNVLAESTIRVVAGDNALVVQRGMDRQSYSCAPACQPTERLGDDDKYATAVASQALAHSARLSGSSAPTTAVMPH